MKTLVRRFLDRRGYTLVTHESADERALFIHLRDLFARLRPDLVVDIGAHKGRYGTQLREEAGYRGRMISFEPVRRNAEIAKTRTDDLWQVRMEGVGRTPGTLDMHVHEGDGQMSSFLSWGTERASTSVIESMPVTTLDLAVPKDARRIFLKVDTQGYELEVLAGCSDFSRIVAMQLEVAFVRLYENQPRFEDVLAHVRGLGYDMAAIYRTNRLRYPTSLVDADAVFVRRDLMK
jgi:FkbM family methyltransferase